MGFYNEDLSFVHHEGFTKLAVAGAHYLQRILRSKGFQDEQIVDLGSGSGVSARELTRAGFHVYGIDYSADMVNMARKTAPKATFQQGSIFQSKIPPCVAVSAFGEVLNYTVDEKDQESAIRQLSEQIKSQLHANGIFLLDFITPEILDEPLLPKNIETTDWRMHVRFEKDVERQWLIRHIDLTRMQNGITRKTRETHTAQLFTVEAIAEILAGSGFRCNPIKDYGDYRMRPGHWGLLATPKSGSEI